MELMIGVDIGTSGTKVLAYDTSGIMAAHYYTSYEPITGEAGQHELDAETLLQAVTEGIKQVVQQAGKGILWRGVSFSCAMHSLLLVDAAGQLLTQVITWADQRSQAYARQLKGTPEGRQIYARTGTPVHPMSPLCKLMWLRDQQPALFAAADKFVSIKEYIFYRFFGDWWIDHSIASATGLFDIYQLDWMPEALTVAGITVDRLSKPVSTTTVITGLPAGYAMQMGLPAHTPFIIGASDGCLANLGCNAVHPGDVALTVGTSGAVRMVNQAPRHDVQERIFNYVLTEKMYVSGGAINNGGVLLKWYSEHFLNQPFDVDHHSYDYFMQLAMQAPPGAERLLFLPYVLGERAPVWNGQARGVFFGVNTGHTQAHFVRAVLEGIGYGLYQVLHSLEETLGPCKNLYASGGFVHSRQWLQLMADQLGKTIQVTNVSDASALGAALLGWKAIGVWSDFSTIGSLIRVQERFEPDATLHAFYKKYFDVYATLYEPLSPSFDALAALPTAPL